MNDTSTPLISTSEIDQVIAPLRDSSSIAQSTLSDRLKTITNWVVIVLVLGAGAWGALQAVFETPASRDWLASRGIGENPALIEARRNAEGLAADPNQSLPAVIAAFEDVIRYDPEDLEARVAIELAIESWKSDFESALTTNQLSLAQTRVSDLLSIEPGNESYISMYERLQNRKQALRLASDTAALMRVAEEATDEPREMAVQAYREVLRLYPASAEAVEQLSVLGTYFVDAAIREAQAGQIDRAIDYLQQADLADPSHQRLPEARDEVQKATTLKETIDSRLVAADRFLRMGRLTQPENDNAAELYHSVLATDPDNEAALQGLGRVSTAVVTVLEEFLEGQQFGNARRLIERSKVVGLYPASIILMESRLTESMQQVAEVERLVTLAESRLQKGLITEPLEDSALDYLQAGLAILPNHARALELLSLCAERLSEVAEEARQAGLNALADEYLVLVTRTTQTASVE